MFDTKVATTYANGTTISFDANDALNFLVGLSITVINTVRDTIEVENELGRKVPNNKDSSIISTIEHYNSGVPEAIYSCILQTNADILLKFVQDVVLNESVKGLYLFYHQSNIRNGGEAPYDLIVKALEDVHNYYMLHGNDNYKTDKNRHYNRYNEEFIKLIYRP